MLGAGLPRCRPSQACGAGARLWRQRGHVRGLADRTARADLRAALQRSLGIRLTGKFW